MLGFVFIYIVLFGFDCLHLLEYFGNGEQCQDKNNGEARDKELDTQSNNSFAIGGAHVPCVQRVGPVDPVVRREEPVDPDVPDVGPRAQRTYLNFTGEEAD